MASAVALHAESPAQIDDQQQRSTRCTAGRCKVSPRQLAKGLAVAKRLEAADLGDQVSVRNGSTRLLITVTSGLRKRNRRERVAKTSGARQSQDSWWQASVKNRGHRVTMGRQDTGLRLTLPRGFLG
jgi:hypothetical protein